jgi:hypothetical protein
MDKKNVQNPKPGGLLGNRNFPKCVLDHNALIFGKRRKKCYCNFFNIYVEKDLGDFSVL